MKTKNLKRTTTVATLLAGGLVLGTSTANAAAAYSYDVLGTGGELRSELLSKNTISANADFSGFEKATEAKCGEGKCGEGKCGAADKKDSKKGKKDKKAAEAKCGADKKKDAQTEKTAEAKCGADKKKDAQTEKTSTGGDSTSK